MQLTKALRARVIQLGASEHASDDVLRKRCSDFLVEGKLSAEEFAELTKPDGSTTSKAAEFARLVAGEIRADDIAAKAFGTDGASTGPGPRIRVKDSSESYSLTKSLAGRAPDGREIYRPSEWENAQLGVFLKRQAAQPLTEHEKAIWGEMVEKSVFLAPMGGGSLETCKNVKAVSGLELKALLDDGTSGGQEVVPAFFDANIVQFPLLHGELAPYVQTIEIPRGSSIEAASIGNPTATWNVADGSSMTPFVTTSLVAAIDSTVFTLTCAVEVGLDFLADAAANVGQILQQNVGMRFMAELDDVIASGDGSTQPTGLDIGSGITSVASDNGSTGPWTINDLESLLFTVGKQYRHRGPSVSFYGNETTYQRLRAIAVDTSSDQRRVLGMDMDRGSGAAVESYNVLGRPYRVNEDFANSYLGFGDLGKYRLYRRQGVQVKFETGGRELSLKNLGLLVVRARYAGQITDANAFAETTDGQS